MLNSAKIDRVKLVKIEAEGAEPEVLLGLKNYISKVDYVVVDVSAERGESNSHTITQCVNILCKQNFEFLSFYLNSPIGRRRLLKAAKTTSGMSSGVRICTGSSVV